MVNIVPGILAEDKQHLKSEINRLKSFFTEIQIDICDGKFTDSQTVSPGDIDYLNEETVFGFHLMVCDPLLYLDSFIRLKIQNVIIHAESCVRAKPLIALLRHNNIKIGLAVNPKTQIQNLFLPDYDFIQLMGVVPGRQGREFMPEVLEKIAKIRKNDFQKPIWLDGGINDKTARLIKGFDIQTVVVGSYFKDEKVEEKLELLQSELK
jgi:ribulose-phosphate 3-epimerase